jgi:hypothetical protein
MTEIERNIKRYMKVNSEIIDTQKKIITEQKKTIKELLEGWGNSLDVWKHQLKTNLVWSILIYILGLLVGIGVTWSYLK